MIEDIIHIIIIIAGCIFIPISLKAQSKNKKNSNPTAQPNQPPVQPNYTPVQQNRYNPAQTNQYTPTQGAPMKFCPYCGNKIDNHAYQFCPNCSNKL